MEPEPPQEKSPGGVLGEVDLGRLGVEDKADLQLPAKMQLIHRESEIEIVRKWFGWDTVLGTALVVVWGCGIFGYSGFGPIRVSKDNLYIYLLFVAGGVWLIYYTIAGWLNRTHIVVSRLKITVRHRPVPWLGNKEIDVSSLKQLYPKIKIRRSRGVPMDADYEVHALTDDDRDLKLVGGLKSSEQACSIEQQIEKYLRIKDAYIEGGIEVKGWL